MPTVALASSTGQCPPDRQLVRPLLDDRAPCPRLRDHATRCGQCAGRPATLLDRAAALTSVAFSPLQWEAFRRFRLAGQPVHEVARLLHLTWREVWDTSSAILEAISLILDSPEFFRDGLRPSDRGALADPPALTR